MNCIFNCKKKQERDQAAQLYESEMAQTAAEHTTMIISVIVVSLIFITVFYLFFLQDFL